MMRVERHMGGYALVAREGKVVSFILGSKRLQSSLATWQLVCLIYTETVHSHHIISHIPLLTAFFPLYANEWIPIPSANGTSTR